MKTNKKYWKLLIVDGALHFGVETTSAKAAMDFVVHHLPQKAVESAIKACGVEFYGGTYLYDCFFNLKYGINLKFKKYNNLMITKL